MDTGIERKNAGRIDHTPGIIAGIKSVELIALVSGALVVSTPVLISTLIAWVALMGQKGKVR